MTTPNLVTIHVCLTFTYIQNVFGELISWGVKIPFRGFQSWHVQSCSLAVSRQSSWSKSRSLQCLLRFTCVCWPISWPCGKFLPCTNFLVLCHDPDLPNQVWPCCFPPYRCEGIISYYSPKDTPKLRDCKWSLSQCWSAFLSNQVL